MLKRVTHNWTLKLTALILSVALWSHVRGQVNPWELATFKVKLNMETPRGFVLVDGDKLPRTVTVAVRGPRQTLRQLKGGAPANPLSTGDEIILANSRQLRAALDFSSPRKGLQKVPVKAETAWEDVEVIGAKPTEISLALDVAAKREMNVDVELDLPGELRAASVEPSAATVQVSGASNVLKRVERVRAVVPNQAWSAGTRQSGRVVLEAVDEENEVVPAVRLEPAAVTVRARLVERQEEKTIAIRVRGTGSPARGYVLSELESDPARITVRGPQRLLEKISSVSVPLDITGAAGTISRRVRVTIPTGLEIVGSSRVRVRARFEREAAPVAAGDTSPNTLPPPADTPNP